MMKEPWFWREKTLAARAVAASFAPGAALYDAARRFRNAATRPARAVIPVICVGNATVGGVGKTPFAVMLARMLAEDGVTAHFLTRGYRGSLPGPMRVDAGKHGAAAVGDEALLLAAAAPTWVARDRPKGAAAAAAANADLVIMDDGYQNPTIKKTLSILLTDADNPVGNGRLFPAGPLREPAAEAIARADALVSVLSEKPAARAKTSAGAPEFSVWLEPRGAVEAKKVVAFCGVGRPERFFASLRRGGFDLADEIAFPDHHSFSAAAIARLRRIAKEKAARLITTEKDFVRLDAGARVGIDVFAVEMKCDDPTGLKALALRAISDFNAAQGSAR